MAKRLEKIGITEYLTVKTHARELYLPLKADITSVFDIRKGDILRIKIEGKVIKEGGETTE